MTRNIFSQQSLTQQEESLEYFASYLQERISRTQEDLALFYDSIKIYLDQKRRAGNENLQDNKTL